MLDSQSAGSDVPGGHSPDCLPGIEVLKAVHGDADLHGGDLAALVQAWSETSLDWLRPAEVLSIAIERELFPEITLLGQEHQRRTLFGRRVLMAATKRPVGRWRIEAKGEGSSRRYKLVPLAEVAS